MRTACLQFSGVFLGVAAAVAWAAPGRGTPRAAVTAALRVSPEAPDLKARPALVARLRATPHNYFRFVNRPFSEAVCRMFDDVHASLPDVNLHGDAHVEQYAVTSLGWGLTDFDDSSRGPYVIDLIRFGVSLELASRQKGWGSAGWAFAAFLSGYRDALSNPGVDRPPERAVRSALTDFAFDHGLALRRAEAVVDSDPVAPSELEGDFQAYVAAMRMKAPSLPATFFRIKAAGILKTGIGSALDEKYLLRIEGQTEAEGDDQILEAKLVRPLFDSGCVHAEAGPERVSIGMTLIARASFPYSGFFTHGSRAFWVHGWTDDYVELSIASAFPTPDDLRQVAYDVGTQLGRAHPEGRAGKPASLASRRRLLESTRANEGRIREAIDELTEATVEAWWAFRGRAHWGHSRRTQRFLPVDVQSSPGEKWGAPMGVSVQWGGPTPPDDLEAWEYDIRSWFGTRSGKVHLEPTSARGDEWRVRAAFRNRPARPESGPSDTAEDVRVEVGRMLRGKGHPVVD